MHQVQRRGPAPAAVLVAGWVIVALGLALAVFSIAVEFMFEDWAVSIVARVLGGVVGLVLFLSGFGIVQRMPLARAVALWILFSAALVAGLALAVGVYPDFDAAIGPAAAAFFVLLAAIVLGGMLSSEAASRWFLGEPGQFVQYLVGRTATQGLLVLYIAVVGLLIAESSLVARWDLTEDQRFSITDASRKLVRDLEDPVIVKAFFSKNIPEHIVPLQRQVFDILEEYEAASNGRFQIEELDPLQSTAAQSAARSYGVQAQQTKVTDVEAAETAFRGIFGSLVFIYGDKQSEVVDIVSRYNAGFPGLSVLEYEISSRIWQLVNDKPKVGIAGFLTTPPPPPRFPGMPSQGRPRPEFEKLKELLRDSFLVEEMDLKTDAPDPKEMPLLLIVRPKELTDVEVFRIDQYLMKGGRVLAFVTRGTADGRRMPGSRHPAWTFSPFDTGLENWFEHHGVRIPKEFALHYASAPRDFKSVVMDGPLGRGRYSVEVRNWFWPIISSEDSFDKNNPAVQTLKQAGFFWPHPIDVLDHKLAGKTATKLVQTHADESWRWTDLNRVDRKPLDAKTDGPSESEMRASAVVVALEGKFGSYFAEKPVPPSLTEPEEKDEKGDKDGDAADDEGAKKDEDGKKAGGKTPAVVKKSPDTLLVVVGNSLFVSDQALGGADKDVARANSLLALNLVDWLARSKDLIRMRAKHYERRVLEDKTFLEDAKKLREKAQKQEITPDEFYEGLAKLEENQKASWKAWRWWNVGVPCGLVLLAGAIVWIVRAALRSVPARFADPTPPPGVRS